MNKSKMEIKGLGYVFREGRDKIIKVKEEIFIEFENVDSVTNKE